MPDFIRRKTISIDSAEFTISCLTQKALEEFEAEEKKIEGDVAKYFTFRRSVIAYALNRAAVAVADAEKHTEASLKDVLDPGTIRSLFREVLKFSGVPVAEPSEAPAAAAKAGAPGEIEPSSATKIS
jgi:hypothetical protein